MLDSARGWVVDWTSPPSPLTGVALERAGAKRRESSKEDFFITSRHHHSSPLLVVLLLPDHRNHLAVLQRPQARHAVVAPDREAGARSAAQQKRRARRALALSSLNNLERLLGQWAREQAQQLWVDGG